MADINLIYAIIPVPEPYTSVMQLSKVVQNTVFCTLIKKSTVNHNNNQC